jgi:hypothetical protein
MSTSRKLRGPRIAVRSSPIHGKGVFARRAIAKGERIVEYKGLVITEKEADRRYSDDDETKPYHTFLFLVDGAKVIDANCGGNSARWINHSCAPNCESSEEEDGRVFIEALRAIKPGEELTYDYNIVAEDSDTEATRRRFACACGAPKCRGTMLGRKKKR